MQLQLLLLLSRFSCIWLCVTPKTAAHQASPSLGFSRQEHWSALPFLSPMHESEKWKWSHLVVSDSRDPMDCSPPGSSVHGLFQAKVLDWDANSRRHMQAASYIKGITEQAGQARLVPHSLGCCFSNENHSSVSKRFHTWGSDCGSAKPSVLDLRMFLGRNLSMNSEEREMLWVGCEYIVEKKPILTQCQKGFLWLAFHCFCYYNHTECSASENPTHLPDC